MSAVVAASRHKRSIVAQAYDLMAKADKAGKAKAKIAKKSNLAIPQLALPKDNAVRSEPYRRLVASIPCKQCQVSGHSQAAHPPCNGKAIKQDDRECFPLCTTRAGPKGAIEGCHPKFDQYKLYPHDKAVKKARQWAAETRAEIEDADLWPKKLPKWKDKK